MNAALDSESVDAALKALDDIKEWLTDQGATAIVASLNDPITDEELEALEAELGYPISPELRAVYRTHNGQKNWGDLKNTFFRHGIGGFCDFKSAVGRDDWRKFIGPWFQPGAPWDPVWDSFTPLERKPEQTVDRAWMHVDDERTTSDLLPEECSTAWLVFGWEETFAGAIHLRTGRVFERAKDEGLTFVADSFGDFLVGFANDLWDGKYKIKRDDWDEDEPVDLRPWIWE
jgi:hypothetical protein